jgi:hypothetical protein
VELCGARRLTNLTLAHLGRFLGFLSIRRIAYEILRIFVRRNACIAVRVSNPDCSPDTKLDGVAFAEGGCFEEHRCALFAH